jgi:aryl-alcohol dehydrogenase-like predicted oxidoreductase
MRDVLLGRSGLRVSQLCLGTMTFGTAWGFGTDEESSRDIYRAYRDAGGNFIDTANNYTEGAAEEIVGRLVAGERDSLVLATKFTLPTVRGDRNSGGGHRKSLRRSLEASLRRFGTDHVDVLWVHAWDRATPVDETLRALDDAVAAGQVLAIGVSNTPAWMIARSQTIAELRGWAQYCGIQVEYSLARRDPERELIPMADQLGLAVTAWSPLAMGLLSGKFTPGSSAADDTKRGIGARGMSDRDRAIVDATATVADELGTTSARVALAWLLRRRVIPVLGARTLAQVQDNLGAADLSLSVQALARLDDASAIRLGYPHDFLEERRDVLDVP